MGVTGAQTYNRKEICRLAGTPSGCPDQGQVLEPSGRTRRPIASRPLVELVGQPPDLLVEIGFASACGDVVTLPVLLRAMCLEQNLEHAVGIFADYLTLAGHRDRLLDPRHAPAPCLLLEPVARLLDRLVPPAGKRLVLGPDAVSRRPAHSRNLAGSPDVRHPRQGVEERRAPRLRRSALTSARRR
jgi:hypothetical protein